MVVAAGAGDLAGVRKAIEKGAVPSKGNYDGRTALHAAAAAGKIPVVRRLVDELGAKVNAKDHWQGTPLDDAVREGHKAVAEFLLQKGAVCGKQQDAPSDYRMLYEAIIKGNVECVKSLVRSKADIHTGNADKRTPLHAACAKGNQLVVKVLVDEGRADVNASDRLGSTPLDECLRGNHKDVADYMRRRGAKAGKAIVNTEAAASLCDAAARGDVQKLRELRASGVDVNCGDYDMRTAIHLAASEGLVEVIEVIVNELGGNQNVTDRWGGTPMDDAIRGNHTEVKQFLEHHHGVRGFNQMFGTDAGLLCDAAAKDDYPVFIGMAKQSANLDLPNLDRRTPLHIAAAEGHLQSVKVLVDNFNVMIDPKDRWEHTPLDEAIYSGHDEVASFLKERGASQGTKPTCTGGNAFLLEAVLHSDIRAVRHHIEVNGYDVNSVNFDSRTPLHLACSLGDMDMVRILVEDYRVHLDPVDHAGGTPLDDAVDNQHEEIIQFLEEKGASVCRTAEPTESLPPDTAVVNIEPEQKSNHKKQAFVDVRRGSAILSFGVAAFCCEDTRDMTDAIAKPMEDSSK